MKRNYWLVIIIASLLGMFFIPKMAYSAEFRAIPRVNLPAAPILPIVSLPNLPLPFPSTIPGPAIQLPIPAIPVVSVPERIQVTGIAMAPRQEKGVFASAQKAFAAAPGAAAPSSQQLNTGFDEGTKTAVHAGAVEVEDAPRPQPKRQQKKRVENSRVIQLPTWELENEIGI
jgi:hypothetical protein